MIDHERTMLVYLKLAEIARLKKQTMGRDRFLVLGGAAALRAGWPDVAEKCRAALLAAAARHPLSQYDTFADALRDPDFKPYLARTDRFCPFEQAESLLDGLGLTPEDLQPRGEETNGELAARWIG